MEKDRTGLERTILLATSALTALTALFTAAGGLSDSVRKFVGIFAGFNEWQLGVAALVLVAVSWWLFRLSRRRRSVLLHPEALRLERANPAHLFGRREDIDQLTRLCREEPLLFLEGESGAGKSALLQAGLVPALKGHPGLLPIYVESLAGSDWERDPRVFLATALWSALDEASRERMGLKTVPGAHAVRAALETASETLGRTPLVVLDQFDDYQHRHHERFLSRKTWLKPGRLSELNGFWRDLRELLASGTIHLVVVTRTDTAAGLSSVWFAEPETYRLDRLSSHFVGPLLAELAKTRTGRR
jgi:conflict system STAND superfamily ATPase